MCLWLLVPEAEGEPGGEPGGPCSSRRFAGRRAGSELRGGRDVTGSAAALHGACSWSEAAVSGRILRDSTGIRTHAHTDASASIPTQTETIPQSSSETTATTEVDSFKKVNEAAPPGQGAWNVHAVYPA